LEAGSHCVAQPDLKFSILLPQPPECLEVEARTPRTTLSILFHQGVINIFLKNKKTGTVAHTYNPSYLEGRGRMITVEGQLR
jgi:hypothetical protein